MQGGVMALVWATCMLVCSRACFQRNSWHFLLYAVVSFLERML